MDSRYEEDISYKIGGVCRKRYIISSFIYKYLQTLTADDKVVCSACARKGILYLMSAASVFLGSLHLGCARWGCRPNYATYQSSYFFFYFSAFGNSCHWNTWLRNVHICQTNIGSVMFILTCCWMCNQITDKWMPFRPLPNLLTNEDTQVLSQSRYTITRVTKETEQR